MTSKMKKLVAWFLLALLGAHGVSTLQENAEDMRVRDLYPEQPLLGERVVCGEPQLYRLHALRPDAVYDLKVSYPATLPTTFELRVERVLLPLPVAGGALTAGPRRRVLNTAKLRLHPQELATHETVRYRLEGDGILQADVTLLAHVEGVPRLDDALLHPRQCHFDVALEELMLEAFPRHTLALIAWLLLLVVGSARWLLPYLQAKVALQRHEDVDDHAAAAKQS